MRVRMGERVLHLRGQGALAAIVRYSIAPSVGCRTESRAPEFIPSADACSCSSRNGLETEQYVRYWRDEAQRDQVGVKYVTTCA
jgi:hypothetical protein